MFQTRTVSSPLGPLALWALDDHLVGLEFVREKQRVSTLVAALEREFHESGAREVPDPAGAATRLEKYFAGDLTQLAAQPVRLKGTAFQLKAWEALRRIPCGQTRSYAEQAAAIGQPNAVRAIGTANGSNRIAIFVPCHRVIASRGGAGGYGGGLPAKRWLLRHEGALDVSAWNQAEFEMPATAGR